MRRSQSLSAFDIDFAYETIDNFTVPPIAQPPHAFNVKSRCQRANMNRLIAVNRGAAATTIVALKGKSKAGQAIMYSLIAGQVYIKRGGRWLLASHHASRTLD